MGRSPSSEKAGLSRGAWSAQEDRILIDYIKNHGEGKWGKIAKETGLKRCGKSCRLRWLNYLRPDIKRGNIAEDEEDLIIRLHKLVGNRWSLIAGRIPGRTDNEIKNYWNSTLKRKLQANHQKQPEIQLKSTKETVFQPCLEEQVEPNTLAEASSTEAGAEKMEAISDSRDEVLLTETKNDETSWNFVMDLNEFLHTEFSELCEFSNMGFRDCNNGNKDESSPFYSEDDPLFI